MSIKLINYIYLWCYSTHHKHYRTFSYHRTPNP